MYKRQREHGVYDEREPREQHDGCAWEGDELCNGWEQRTDAEHDDAGRNGV